MPARSPEPILRPEKEAMTRSKSAETPANGTTMASLRRPFVTPSPAGTAATEAMTPMIDTPECTDTPMWSNASQSDMVSDTALRARSLVSLQDEEPSREAPPPEARSPDGEWRIRTLFLGDKKAHKSPAPEHKRSHSYQDYDGSAPPLSSRSLISGGPDESDSSVPSSSLKSSRRRKSRASQSSRHSKSLDDWSVGNSARRRSSSFAPILSETTPSKSKPLVETPTTSSSSDEHSPDTSPCRQSSSSRTRRASRWETTSPAQDGEGSSLVSRLKYRLGRVRNNRLLILLCLVGMVSLGLTVITNRAVIKVEKVIVDDELVNEMKKPFDRRTVNPPAAGLRGSMVHKAGKHKGKKGHKDDKKSVDSNKRKKDEDKKRQAKEKKGKEAKTKTDNKAAATDPKKTSAKAPSDAKDLVTSEKVKASSSTGVKKLTVASPPSKKSLKTKQDFSTVDQKMFDSDAKSKSSRVVYLHDSLNEKNGPFSHRVQLYPSDFTDNTQLYGVLDSRDERLKKMEIREPYEDKHCRPMKEWQTTYHPSCNAMHEMALDHLVREEENDINLFGTRGFWRNAWKLDMLGGHRTKEERDTVVLKTLKFEHNFEDAHFEHDRIDAVAMERLTSSPHVINVFGFCGHSVVSEYADGSRLGALADKSKKTPLARLQIARDIANGLADVHGIDGDEHATFVHLDINPANVVSIGGTLKLNDFNIGIVRRWNVTSDKPCGFPAQYPNPQWRSPEEARNEQNLTEKVDVFSMGHIFFRLICGHEPWNKLEPGGRPSKEDVNAKVKKGGLPHIPQEIMESDDKEVIAIREAMLRCYTFDPEKRPSAREISNSLQATLDELSTSIV